jgi:hypothetical protein
VTATFPPNTVIVEVDPLQDPDEPEQHGPKLYWARGPIGALLSAATVADMLASGLNAFRLFPAVHRDCASQPLLCARHTDCCRRASIRPEDRVDLFSIRLNVRFPA